MLGAALADPNVAFLLLVLGALGVYWEVHAPGMVLPGLLGVLLICTGAYGIYQDSPTWYGLTLLVLALILLTIELKYYTHMVSGVAGTILLAFGALGFDTGTAAHHAWSWRLRFRPRLVLSRSFLVCLECARGKASR